MICPQCGNQVPANPKFCSRCGLDFEYVRRYEPELLKKMQEEDQAAPVFGVGFTSSMGGRRGNSRTEPAPAPKPVREARYEVDPVPTPPPKPTVSEGPEPPVYREKKKKSAAPAIIAAAAACLVLILVLAVAFPRAQNGDADALSKGNTAPIIENPVTAMNLVRIDGTTDAYDYTINVTHSAYGQPVSCTYQDFEVECEAAKLEWDEQGRLIAERYYDDYGTETEHYLYTYDAADNITRIDIYLEEDGEAANEMSYDDQGRMIEKYLYDGSGKLLENYYAEYDGDNLVYEYYGDGESDHWITYYYRYDESGFLHRMEYYDADDIYEYTIYEMLDDYNEQETRYDSEGSITGYTVYTYDERDNRLIAQYDYDQNWVCTSKYDCRYDDHGNMTWELLEEAGESVERTYSYDADGLLVYSTYYCKSAEGESVNESYTYTYEQMEVPEEMADHLTAGIEMSELGDYYVTILE